MTNHSTLVVAATFTLIVVASSLGLSQSATELDTDPQFLVCSSSGGVAPYTLCVTFREDLRVSYGRLGEETPCAALDSSQFGKLTARLQTVETQDLLLTLSVAAYDQKFHDCQGLSLHFDPPLQPWLASDISLPRVLLPVQLLPLTRLVDELGTAACGDRYEPMSPPCP
jgi:hypothetical protein